MSPIFLTCPWLWAGESLWVAAIKSCSTIGIPARKKLSQQHPQQMLSVTAGPRLVIALGF
jgi:hypothetical protein